MEAEGATSAQGDPQKSGLGLEEEESNLVF